MPDLFEQQQQYRPLPDKVQVKYATLFSIDYHNTYKVVNNLSTKDTYVLYQCGSDKPSVKDASAYIPIPVTSASAWATTAAIFLEALGVQDDIKNLGTAPSMVSACLQKLLDTVIEPFNESNSTAVDQQEDTNTVVFSMPGGSDSNITNTAYSVEYLEPASWVAPSGSSFLPRSLMLRNVPTLCSSQSTPTTTALDQGQQRVQ
ncbi:hypothetical protein BX661DRAFT_213052 [Kickxella alabastrina]|uniref:uncharacterized protein n=1 Tax=Kickxella alabastrina TaxID=61397 RepID=UPI0022209606|nr:uncharacterized protein BX661DRAFT_213052 [Kickxella alabastrina]KAI7826714.1 hypothetical protein BX661DRAFT_213052 [Kickxella alabastrina]